MSRNHGPLQNTVINNECNGRGRASTGDKNVRVLINVLSKCQDTRVPCRSCHYQTNCTAAHLMEQRVRERDRKQRPPAWRTGIAESGLHAALNICTERAQTLQVASAILPVWVQLADRRWAAYDRLPIQQRHFYFRRDFFSPSHLFCRQQSSIGK